MTRKPSMHRFLAGPGVLLATIAMFALAPAARGQTQTSEQPVAEQLDQLASSLRATQLQVRQSEQQIQQMQAEIDRLRALLATAEPESKSGSASIPSAPASASTESPVADAEDIEILKSASAQQQQTKVESSSRLPVRLTGLVLFNAFVNQGNVDQIDLPSSALLSPATSSNTSTGASLRQTILGLEGTGPVLAGAQTSARVSMDFFGGVTGSASSSAAGIARLRTAAITARWARNTLEASYDTPLISPLSPESFATTAQPALAWSGNLWTWAPQFVWTHTVPMHRADRTFAFRLGLIDTQTLNAASNLTQRSTGAGETSGQPSYETHLAYGSGATDRRFELGVGGFYGRQSYKGGKQIDTWATTADWRIPFGDKVRLSGELYHGRGIGSLGGGAYRDIVSYSLPNSTETYVRALDAEGGWLQWSYRFSSTLRANVAVGQDSASNSELRQSVPLYTINPIFFYARNRSTVGNLIFRPWSSIIISPEYRRLQSWPIFGGVNTANIYTLTFGYQF